jgi:hypothetical protein
MLPWLTAVAPVASVLFTALIHVLISRGYMRRVVEQYDADFKVIAEEQKAQDEKIEGSSKTIAQLVAELKGVKCPLPACPMRLGLPAGDRNERF